MTKIERREALAALAVGAGGLACATTKVGKSEKTQTTHYITLGFDDGFAKSVQRVAEIHEAHGLRACINVIASGHHDDFEMPDNGYIKPEILGDFTLWNDLKARGHELMCHGYKHANKADMPLADAQALIEKCLQYFADNLDDFRKEEAIFNFPFNSSSPEIEAWLAPRVRAFRTGEEGGNPWNPFPAPPHPKLICISKGPENIDAFLDQKINEFLAGPAGWFVFNTHGLDEEGWGWMNSDFLDELLGRLVKTPGVAVLPVGAVLDLSEA